MRFELVTILAIQFPTSNFTERERGDLAQDSESLKNSTRDFTPLRSRCAPVL